MHRVSALTKAVPYIKSVLSKEKHCGLMKWSSVHYCGIFQPIILFRGDKSPFISMEMPRLRLRGSLQVWTVIRASFLFLSDWLDSMIVARHLQRWKPITGWGMVFHTNMSPSSLNVYVFGFLTLSLSPWLFKWIGGFAHLSVIVLDAEAKIFNMNLSVSLLWGLWLIGAT